MIGKLYDPLSYSGSKTGLGSSVFRTGSFPIYANISITNTTCSRSNALALSPIRSYEREPLSDRKIWYHQFKPRVFTITVFRIVALQFGQVFSNYYVDMMEEAMKLDKKVMDENDPMTREQANLLEEIWSQTEWEKRFDVKSILSKCKTLIVNSHLISLVMRALEGQIVASCTPEVADLYMIDTFSEAKHKFDKDYITGTDEGKTKTDIAREMAVVCLRANAIAYLADYIVFQCRLAYIMFVKSSASKQEEKYNNFVRSSLKLVTSRSIGLLASSIGAMIGTLILPPGGYGTLLGSNVGDGLIGALMENS